jgi:valyl-tRNA synthetase
MLPKGPYNSQNNEPEILKYWLENKFFKPEYDAVKGLISTEEMKKDNRESFCIVNPPPNAYMRPHIGNVSGYAYQDVFLRYNRLLGKKVLGQPGKDHAGIQGEVVVEKIFIKEKGKSKRDMGREQFYAESYAHFEKLMPMVMADEQRIGLSSDYDRNLFTLDPKVVNTVLGTFIKMFGDQMVYKGVRIVNWDPVAKTTLADIDTERQERESELVYIKYPIGKVSTTVLDLKTKFTNQTITFQYKRNKTRDGKKDLPFAFGEYADYKINDEVLGIFGIGFEAQNVGEALIGEVIGIQLRLDKQYKLVVKNPQFTGDLQNEIDKIFDFEKEYYPGAHIVLFSEDKTDKDFSDGIIVATTRAETMIGDTAVTVNPSDARYTGLMNEKITLPLVDREIPFITSPFIEKEFGTGAVKLTPAHAYDDYVMMNEWNLANPGKEIGYINIIDKSARMIGPIPAKYLGMKTEECRTAVINDLIAQNLLIKREKHLQSVMIGERSKAVIEQIMSSQWFIDVEKLKGPAMEAVESGKIKIHPSNMSKKYLQWMGNLKDWPVSRSLWWGYRIPVWYKGELKESINEAGQVVETIDGQVIKDIYDAASKGLALVQQENPGEGWIQDNDVFDTWFSSGQWPYATLTANEMSDTFFPSSVMETGYDILELWVSRMVMLSLYHEGKIPFKDVYLHGLVKAPDGQKMSKSKNNVIAPESIIEKYGADSLRLLYTVGNKAGAGYPVSYEKLEGYKRFLNKIWNAAKFVEMNLEDMGSKITEINSQDLVLLPEDKTMQEHMHQLITDTTKRLNSFHVGIAAQELYESFWHTFADIYIEAIKGRLFTKDREGNPINTSDEDKAKRLSAQWMLYYTFKTYLKLLHPFIPFITETIWQSLAKAEGESQTIMYAKWPE